MKTITLLVGNIGSGKTTWIKKHRKKDEIVISRDALRYMIGAGDYIFDVKIEPTIWATELFMVEETMEKSFNIIVDEVGINRSLRDRYIQLAKIYDYNVIVVEMKKLTMKESVDRRMNNPHSQPSRKIWEQVWEKFDNMYEPPSKDEGIDKIIKME